MSNIYIKEPGSCGKVLIHTSMGDIDVELWAKEAPLACRNFVQLCMEGYYNNIIFHRVVPNFIVQGGDPTGTGEGGESIYGKPFKDEFHSRLRFVRRGLVAMANAGPNDNGSQFFFTLGPCNDLNKKHTIFGKVTGDTIYNLVRLGEVHTDDNERPVNPPHIKWTKVLANPFDDIEPRVIPDDVEKKEEKKKQKKSRMKATKHRCALMMGVRINSRNIGKNACLFVTPEEPKDFTLLSFGEEAEADEKDNIEFDASHVIKSKSSHDVGNDPKLLSTPAVDVTDKPTTAGKRKAEDSDQSDDSDSDDDSSDQGAKEERMERIRDKLKHSKQKSAKLEKTDVDHSELGEKKISRSEELRQESKRLAREILKARKEKSEAKQEAASEDESSEDEAMQSNPLYADFKNQQKKYKQLKTKEKGSSRESATLAMLDSFKNKLSSVRQDAGWESEEEVEEKPLADDDDDSGWLLHRLKKDSELRDAKDMNRDVNEDRYDISDPRNPLNKRRREKSSKKHKDSKEHRHRRREHR